MVKGGTSAAFTIMGGLAGFVTGMLAGGGMKHSRRLLLEVQNPALPIASSSAFPVQVEWLRTESLTKKHHRDVWNRALLASDAFRKRPSPTSYTEAQRAVSSLLDTHLKPDERHHVLMLMSSMLALWESILMQNRRASERAREVSAQSVLAEYAHNR